MEAAAISVAKASLTSVVNLASTFITEEIGLLLGVRQELFFIKEELEMMRAFLQAVSAEKVKGETVITWVKQVQELSFDVEDCLQEASVNLMKKHCLPSWCSVKKRDNMARKIQALKARIEDVSNRNKRYGLVKNSGAHKNDPIYNQVTSTKLSANDKALIVGLDKPTKKLVELIRKDQSTKRKVISVVGMGGLGKTTLVRKVCDDLSNEFKLCWVNVLHPFNREEFIESLVKQILDKTQKDRMKGQEIESKDNTIKIELINKTRKEIMDEKEREVTKYLQDRKYLIVLDDLSSKSEWAMIETVLPKSNGSRIIVTTRSNSLAEHISCSGDIYKIKALSRNEAKYLFFRIVYKISNYGPELDDGDAKEDQPSIHKPEIKYGLSSSEIIKVDGQHDGDTKEDVPLIHKVEKKINPSTSEIIKDNCEVDGDVKENLSHKSMSNVKNDPSNNGITNENGEDDGAAKEDLSSIYKPGIKYGPNSSTEITDGEHDGDTKEGLSHECKSNVKYDHNINEIIEVDSELLDQFMMNNKITLDMGNQAKLIIEKCDGLPIAIVAIGSYLATRPKTSAEWKAVYHHLRSEIVNNPDLDGVKTILSSSYDVLPYHLKSCLLYLSVFHNHQEIRRTRIVRRWMADGYVIGDHDKMAEDVGKDYFYDLMGRSLIQPSQKAIIINGDVHRCNIHDVMYELILEKSMGEKVVSLLENENLKTRTDKMRHY